MVDMLSMTSVAPRLPQNSAADSVVHEEAAEAAARGDRTGSDLSDPPPRESRPTEYAELKWQVESAGLMRRQRRYFLAKLGSNALLFGVAYAGLLLAATNPWWWLADVMLLAFAFGQMALLGHDIAHLQFVRAGRLNTALGLMLGNVLLGVSQAWWKDNHNAHHAHPNALDRDPNVNILFLACTPEQALARPRWVQWIIRHQVSLLLPIFGLEFFSMHQQSIDYVIRRRPGCARLEGWLLAAHFALYGGLLLATLGVGGALAFAFVHHVLTGMYLGSIFAPNHKGMPLANGSTKSNFLREQVLTSRNVRGNWLIDLVYGGLNYQIEHHLFPTLARNQLRRAAPIVRAYCEAHAIPYAESGIVTSWRVVVSHYGDVSRGVSALV
jgi:fatty acid desaturase